VSTFGGEEVFLTFVVPYAGMGSFDFVRLAPHFAQDDSANQKAKKRPAGWPGGRVSELESEN
jgi:hypothetical protein